MMTILLGKSMSKLSEQILRADDKAYLIAFLNFSIFEYVFLLPPSLPAEKSEAQDSIIERNISENE